MPRASSYRRDFFLGVGMATAGLLLLGHVVHPGWWWGLAVVVPLGLLGLRDVLQRRHAVLRNWPLIGRVRYLFEAIRPEIQQYFVESDTDERPFSRESRAVAYQRSKGVLDTMPFGTLRDVYEVGYEWMAHSLAPRPPALEDPRVLVGGPACTRPYAASHLGVSAMSFGALSGVAIEALNRGAKAGGFWHNTGEGGIGVAHRHGGDLVWQIGTGYFGCRTRDGRLDEGLFAERASDDQVKMVEIKLSQGAKPGHGGILPAAKVTPEIAAMRGVPVGREVDSPPAHTAFSTPRGLLELVARLRDRCGGKPVGIKLCVGVRSELLGVVKAMLATGITPDFVTVDGGEGGTGAAPVEFSNSVGMPLRDGLVFVHNALVGAGLRDRVRLIAAGKIVTGFHMVRALALGADLCAAARGFMFSLGCIQARRCNSNKCPVGVATQDPALQRGLVVEDKVPRVERFQRETVLSFLDLVGAAGLASPRDIRPHHVWRRVTVREARHLGESYVWLDPGALLLDPLPAPYLTDWLRASPDRF